MFGTLQHSTFPVYFNLSIVLGGGLLGLWGYSHPAVLDHYAEWQRADVAQAYALGSLVLAQSANQFVVGPLTSKCVWYRISRSFRSNVQLQDNVSAPQAGEGRGEKL